MSEKMNSTQELNKTPNENNKDKTNIISTLEEQLKLTVDMNKHLNEELIEINSKFSLTENERFKKNTTLKEKLISFFNKINEPFKSESNKFEDINFDEFFNEKQELKYNFDEIYEEKFFCYIKKIHLNLREENKTNKENFASLNNNLNKEIETLTSEMDKTEKKFKIIKEKYEENLKIKSSLEKENNELNIAKNLTTIENLNLSKKLKEISEDFEKYKTKYSDLCSDVENLEKNKIDNLNLISDLNNKIENLYLKNSNLTTEINKFSKDYNLLNVELKLLKNENDNSQIAELNLNNQNEEFKKKFETISENEKQNKILIEKLILEKKDLEKLNNEAQKIISQNFEQEISELKNQLNSQVETIEKNDLIINNLKKEIESYKNTQETLNNIENQIKIKDILIDKITQEKNNLAEEYKEKEKVILISAEIQKKNFNQEISKEKELNLNLNLSINEKKELIINLEEKLNELTEKTNRDKECFEEECNKKVLDMELIIDELKDNILQGEAKFKEDNKLNTLVENYIDLKEKCLQFIRILENELKDYSYLIDQRIVINFLLKYFDKNSNEKIKFSVLDTLANILNFENEDRKKLNLPTNLNPNYSSNNKNLNLEAESVPIIIAKFSDYLDNID